jgi:mRNA interferase MazF
MITSAAQHPWPLDHDIADLGAAGLRVPSKVRFKLFTLDQRLVREVLGMLAEEDRLAVGEALRRLLGRGA